MENKLYGQLMLACKVVFPKTNGNVVKLHHSRWSGSKQTLIWGGVKAIARGWELKKVKQIALCNK